MTSPRKLFLISCLKGINQLLAFSILSPGRRHFSASSASPPTSCVLCSSLPREEGRQRNRGCHYSLNRLQQYLLFILHFCSHFQRCLVPSFLSWVTWCKLVCFLVFHIFSLGFDFLSNAESVTKCLLSCLQNLVLVFSSFLFVCEGLGSHPTLLCHHVAWFQV